MTITVETLAIILAIIFFAHVVQTITGFAGSMLAIPFLTFVISLPDAKVLITAVGLVWSLWILTTDHQFIDWRFLGFAITLMSIGMVVGTWLVKIVPSQGLMIVMGITIIVSAIRNLVIHSSKTTKNPTRDVIFGFSAGVMQGMVLMGGPLLVVLTNAHFTDRRYYRATLAALWLLVDIILLGIFWFDHVLTAGNLMLTGISVIPLVLSIVVGNRLNAHINAQRFNQLVNGLLIFSGITILVQGIR